MQLAEFPCCAYVYAACGARLAGNVLHCIVHTRTRTECIFEPSDVVEMNYGDRQKYESDLTACTFDLCGFTYVH